MLSSQRNMLIVLLIAIAVLSRFVPHPPNFAAVGAVGLFAGASFGNRWLSLLIPLLAMTLSDIVFGFSWMTPVIYFAMSFYVLAGWWAAFRRVEVASRATSRCSRGNRMRLV